ncbi:ATP-dependent helicase ULS1-like [Lycium ferocissimum]|uniref:ATP-dependent helicase ULS1-like n=1 Tax=Lycium ferocissimum TaxID=112874 RepID=UPI002814BF84|nr:ATP-dependent helicase ULS1-like [Lycium ferocissimum]
MDNFLLENYSDDFDLDNQNVSVSETAEAPSDLILPLLRYQKKWLAWSLKQEESKAKGGILADEMGMGKAVQAIALVLAKRELQKASSDSSIMSSSASTSQELPVVKGTLVVCPVVGAMHGFVRLNVALLKEATKLSFIMAPTGRNLCTNWRNRIFSLLRTPLSRLTIGQSSTERTQNLG